MKKTIFYSMVRENGQNIAKLQKGYTDGTFNYYKRGENWYAIHPINGLSVCTDNTRKAAAEKAHTPTMMERIAAALEQKQHLAEQFAAAMKQAKEAV